MTLENGTEEGCNREERCESQGEKTEKSGQRGLWVTWIWPERALGRLDLDGEGSGSLGSGRRGLWVAWIWMERALGGSDMIEGTLVRTDLVGWGSSSLRSGLRGLWVAQIWPEEAMGRSEFFICRLKISSFLHQSLPPTAFLQRPSSDKPQAKRKRKVSEVEIVRLRPQQRQSS
ncbi:hypothetical protein TIFTF001_012825 [Ficus carica]|uniref:Uncharacterized protein n=1 Tax=Ficus carica TaxID=3494 RepID=A0AA88ANW4_FICCA|nr:hypothetical protein TIFTF001_012825 [Ficus carica]